MTVRVDCLDPDRALRFIEASHIGAGSSSTDSGLIVTLPPGSAVDDIVQLNRKLVEAGIEVYGLQEVRASLEDWFLTVTSRLGEAS
jgi:hypothetical protein